MPDPEIEEFAAKLIKQVRDLSIQDCDGTLNASATNRIAERWRKSAQSGDLNAFARTVICDTVDEVVFRLLDAIDNGKLPLSFQASNGKKVDLPSAGLGELAGWFVGTDSWRAKYSKERFFDDASNC